MEGRNKLVVVVVVVVVIDPEILLKYDLVVQPVLQLNMLKSKNFNLTFTDKMIIFLSVNV